MGLVDWKIIPSNVAASMIPKCIWQQIFNCEISYISININNSMWSKISQPLTASSARCALLNGCPLLHIDTCHSKLCWCECRHIELWSDIVRGTFCFVCCDRLGCRIGYYYPGCV